MVVLTKADLCLDVEAAVLEVELTAIGVPVHVVQQPHGRSIEELAPYFAAGRTVAALGSSGVGKSSLVNRLAGKELMARAPSAPTAAGATRPRTASCFASRRAGCSWTRPGCGNFASGSPRKASPRPSTTWLRRSALPLRRLLARGRAGCGCPGGARRRHAHPTSATTAGGSSSRARAPGGQAGQAPALGGEKEFRRRARGGGRSPGEEPAPARLSLLPFGTRRQPPGLAGALHALWCARAAVASGRPREQEHVVAHRRELPAAERARVGRRLQVLRAPELPPARLGGHTSS